MAEKPDTIVLPIAETTAESQPTSDGAETDAAALFSQTVADLSNGSALDPAALGIVVPSSSAGDTFGFVQSATAILNQISHLSSPTSSKADQVARAFFRCYVYVDGEAVDSPWTQHAIRPAPIDTLRRLYYAVVLESDRLSESHFFRAMHNYVRDDLVLRDEVVRQTDEFSRLVKEHIRKAKKKLGGTLQFKQRKCYNGLKICAPNWDSLDPSVLFMKEYAHENKTVLPTDINVYNEDMNDDDDDSMMSPPPAKRAKKASAPSSSLKRSGSSVESTASSIVPILAAVAAQQLEQHVIDQPLAPVIVGAPELPSSVSFIRGNPMLRVFESSDRSYVVQILKPAQSTVQIFGPDSIGVYKFTGTYSMSPIPIETFFSNVSSGDFEVEVRVPPAYDAPLVDQLTCEDVNGVLTVYFRPKISSAPLTDLK